MAALPPCSLCRTPEKVRTYFETNKKPFLTYSIFILLVLEWFSLGYQKTFPQTPNMVYDRYLFFWYPLLTQLGFFVVCFSLFLWKDRFHFCYRKSAVVFYLSCYYLLGFLGVLFCFSASIYYTIVSYSSLFIASFLFIVSLYKNRK